MRCIPLAALAAVVFAAPAHAQPAAAEWTRGATCYEVFVRSFHDSDGDGVGDIPGLIQKLDYINDGDPESMDDLGASCIWLMPIAESPSYHGYDVVDYYAVDREYGTSDDFKRLMSEAHRRGIHVLVDMVLNHSSSEHPWFLDAVRGPDARHRDWYLFSAEHPGVRNPWGSDNWHRSPRGDYYFGLFWHGMPDLNVENPEVVAETRRIADFWIREMGVDGFRLDAIRHLVEGGRGAQVEHLPGTHVFLRGYAAHLASVKPDVYTVGEVWDSIGAILPYYPDQLTSHFMFQLSDDVLNAAKSGSAANLFRNYLRLQREGLPPHRYSPFLRNHDQSRTMTVLEGDERKAKVAAALLLTLPGLPFIYYGEEIGIAGDKPDENIRTPMHWTSSAEGGFTTGTPWRAPQADWATRTVAAQDADSASLLNLHRRLIHLRKANPALATGELVPLTASSDAVAAFIRRDGDDAVLVVANLGAAPLQDVALSSDARALQAGDYAAAALFGQGPGRLLRIGAEGRIQGFVPLPQLAPGAFHVLELAPLTQRTEPCRARIGCN